MRDLAIIIPTRNRPDIIAISLMRVREHFPDSPIYVFDDASDDAVTVRNCVLGISNAHILRSEKVIGPAGARRRLIEVANARWCLALDDDCWPPTEFNVSGWIATEPGVGDPIVITFAIFNTPSGEFAPVRGRKYGPTIAIMGGASLLHRAKILEIGNYDGLYVFGGEDTDLARRVWASGYSLWMDPENIIIHDHVSDGRNLRRETYFYVRNRILLNTRTLPLVYGLPLGIAQATKRWLLSPHKVSGFLGILAGLCVSLGHLRNRRPMRLAQFRELERRLRESP